MRKFKINNRLIGDATPAYIIAEVGLSHLGSLELAHSFIDSASESGADAVKFQMHIAEEESTLDEKFRVKISSQFKNRFDYWEKTAFSEESWIELIKHCKKKKITFLCTPFSVKAANILHKFDVSAFKIGSGELTFFPLLNFLKKTKKPILLSTGMSNYLEISNSFKYLNKTNPLALFQCTSLYPTPSEKIGLNVIDILKKKFKVPVGLSDHTGGYFASIAAIALGANIIEVHLCFDKRIVGPDSSSSITFKNLKDLCQARDILNILSNNPVNKDKIALELKRYRKLFSRSFAPISKIKKGTIIQKNLICLKKPGSGIKKEELKSILGKKVKKNLYPNKLIKLSDLENE